MEGLYGMQLTRPTLWKQTPVIQPTAIVDCKSAVVLKQLAD
jgi:hypothetical protein